MKNLSVPSVLALVLAVSNPAMARETSALKQYAAISTAMADNMGGEVDHNADGMTTAPDTEMYDTPMVPAQDVPVVAKQKPIVKPSPIVKKSGSATEVPAPKSKVKQAAAPAREIPLIETENPVETSPDVNYVTGGIGEDEKASIEAAKADYNVHVMSASMNGAFVGDAHVVITSKADNKEMLDVVAGPLLYVKLPEGKYSLDASLGEQKKHQDFTIGGKTPNANVHLGWKVAAVRSED